MIKNLHISNFAIIDEVELDLEDGLTVLTGETGAGKSILVDALGLALGDRADSAAVRHGEKRAEVTVTVAVRELPSVRQWLDEQALEIEDECLIRRVIGADGRSRAFINGQPVPLASLRALGERLVDIHGQHAHQSLTRTDTQRALLDHHGNLADRVTRVREAWSAWQRAARARDEVLAADEDADARLELLRYQTGELAAFAIAEGEYETLSQEHARLSHGNRLLEGGRDALAALYEDEHSAHGLLARCLRRLDPLQSLDAGLAPVLDLLRQAEININESAEALRTYVDNLDIDPVRAETVEQRLHEARELARKHRVDPERLHEVLPRLSGQLDTLETRGERARTLSAEAEQALERCREAARELHAARRDAAGRFAADVSAAMQTLGLQGGRLEVEVTAHADGRLHAHGLDTVSFLVTTNPGQPPAPLARVASGGELSRIALAIQVVAADGSPIPCMVFDEVDAGVGGGVAEMVGRRLRQLGERRQVMCVTHLPQVASQGHTHLRVAKLTDGSSTRTAITALRGDTRVEEIARMLGGVAITERTRAHAREMLETSGRPPDGQKPRRTGKKTGKKKATR